MIKWLLKLFSFNPNNKEKNTKELQNVEVEKTNEELRKEEEANLKTKKTRCPHCGVEDSFIASRYYKTKRLVVFSSFVRNKTTVEKYRSIVYHPTNVVGLYYEKVCVKCGFTARFDKQFIDHIGEL